MVIQKVSTLAWLCKRQMVNKEEVNGSDNNYNEQTSNSVSQEIQSDLSTIQHFTPTSNVVFQVRNGSLVPSQTDLGKNQQLLSSESFINHHGFCKPQLGVQMTSDTDNTMAEEPNSTNYTSGEGKLDTFILGRHMSICI
jgi:hypothetical protein